MIKQLLTHEFVLIPQNSHWTKSTIDQTSIKSSRKFPLNYLSCLFYILKPQNATIRSLFYTLHDVCFTNEASKVQFLRKRRFISAVRTFKKLSSWGSIYTSLAYSRYTQERIYVSLTGIIKTTWATAETCKNVCICHWP